MTDRRTGQRLSKNGFASEVEATVWRNDMLNRRNLLATMNEQKMTVAELVHKYLEATPGRRPSTLAGMEGLQRNYIAVHLNIPVAIAGVSALKAMSRVVTGTSIMPAVEKLVRAAFKWATSPGIGLVVTNPFQGVPIAFKQSSAPRRALTLEEEKLLLDASPFEWGAMWRVMLGTGMRLGEAIVLDVTDWDRRQSLMRISKTSSLAKLEDGSRHFPGTKNGSIRFAPINSGLAETLKELIRGRSSGPIFINPRGESYTPGSWRWRFMVATKRAGIENAVPHCLRHTFITRAIENGIPIRVVSSIVGHLSSMETERVYTHISNQSMLEAVERLHELRGAD